MRVRQWNVNNVINMQSMFYNTKIADGVTVDLSSWVTHDDVEKSFFNQDVDGNLRRPSKW